jgi:predicted ribosome quality control (RQC) complex YloA/Tae2 family protein
MINIDKDKDGKYSYLVTIYTDGNVITVDSEGVIIDEFSGKLPIIHKIVENFEGNTKEQRERGNTHIANNDLVGFRVKNYNEEEDIYGVIIPYKKITMLIGYINPLDKEFIDEIVLNS